MRDYPRQQLLLNVELDIGSTLENFVFGKNNQALEQFIGDSLFTAKERFLYIWGNPGSGKSHLLQALCHEFDAQGMSSIYLPLKHTDGHPTDMLEDLDQLRLVCIDDVDKVAGAREWETALFNFYNRAKEAETVVVFAGEVPAVQLPLVLADFASRMQSAVVFRLHTLDDVEKTGLLQDRAKAVGINLSQAVIDYVMLRSDRKVSDLIQLLSRLEKQSLLEKRRITIPLVKQEMGW